MKVYLIRHGQDTASRRGGWSGEPLTEEGKQQVHQLGRELKDIPINYMYSSDLVRAKETTAILLEYIKCDDIKYDAQLREVNNGQLAGMDHNTAEQLYPGLYWSTLSWEENYPKGESPKQFQQRVIKCWEKIKQQITGDCMLVTHQGVIDIIMCYEHNMIYSNKEVKYKVKPASYIKINVR